MRTLAAALACRMQGSRLYGKPLQNLEYKAGVTILDQLVDLIATLPVIRATVLAIADGMHNQPFVEFADRRNLPYVIGSEQDVLRRLIDAAAHVSATDVFRVTTESPFFYYEKVEEAWQAHVRNGNDLTVVDGLPEGCHFEIWRTEALQRSWDEGEDRHRSELCSLYVVENRDKFTVEILEIPPELERLDLRLTVDHPEDLVVCRRVYEALSPDAPRIAVRDTIDFLDTRPDLVELVRPYVVSKRIY